MIGRTISHYKVHDKIGEGGMGVVYKAEDTRLDRVVALKFLSSHLLESEEARERFGHEAKAAATLDHPNICTVYEIDEADGETFLAMAYIEGPTLKQKIDERPLKLKQALDIAIQIGQGLQAAHERSINHRDIKPANVILSVDGQIKVMDFGLAHLGGRTKITKTGVVMGTPSYMAPEQLRGERTDQRADIWSFGVVLHEMITGRPPFEGDTEESVSYAILHTEPEPLTALRRGVPMELDRVVAKTLAKDCNERYQHMDEALVDLRALRKRLPETTKATVAVAPEEPVTPRQRATRLLPWGLFALTLLALLVLAVVNFRQTPAEPPLRRFNITPPVRSENPVISPDGKYIAFVGEGRLWIHDLGSGQSREIDGTAGGGGPFWSPDSDFIGFNVDRQLKRVPLSGGVAVKICSLLTDFVFGASWSYDGETIIFSAWDGANTSVYQVPADGGDPEPLSAPRMIGVAPSFVPAPNERNVLLFTLTDGEESQIVAERLDTKVQTALAKGHDAVYSPSGHIVYQTDRNTAGLWALPFSLENMEHLGEAFPVNTNGELPSVSRDGTLVYLEKHGEPKMQLVWRDRKGGVLGNAGQPQKDIHYLDLSPDGNWVAVRGTEPGGGANRDIWLHSAERPVKQRVTFHPALDSVPTWAPDGERLAFISTRNGTTDIFATHPDSGAEPILLFGTPSMENGASWSPDARYIVFDRIRPETGRDLWYLDVEQQDDKGSRAVPLLETPSHETSATISPDGRHFAYASDESGRYEVCVRSFPEGEGRWQVSTGGGRTPRWAHSGRELFYVEDDTLVAVEVSLDGVFSAGTPKRLFRSPELRSEEFVQYDVSADGQRIVLPQRLDEDEPATIHVVQNWFAEFRDRQ